MKYKLLIGADDFWACLQSDIRSAQKKVCIQAMTFEADSVGKKVFAALKASAAIDKHLCVDNFSKLTISDHFVYGPHRLVSAEFREEIRDTKEIFTSAKDFGIQLFFTNPLGWFLYKHPHRNHKKMMLIDENIAYIGGINFSEHNFAWHDMMLRIEDDNLAQVFGDDFSHTIAGRNQSIKT
ncbi:hypothetical protein MNBD_ALPHA06-1710, partial [hydrothermal vent metagenome]